MDDAIVARDLSKVYRLYSSPKGRLLEALSFGRMRRHGEMWALRNVGFTVPRGESIGFIGENGAGKSTLLRLLCGSTCPTSGSLAIHGRVAALLELGTGFHPEFTGRQNALFNGLLMGLSRGDVLARMEEIKAFSELGDFFERPVKTYSSGMVVRLGFSVATCVEPDVLLVDEALSVGDEHFQKKSLDRMLRFRDAGKTIVFVSHSMYHIRRVCDRACWLHGGGVRVIGPVDEVIHAYDQYNQQRDGVSAPGDDTARKRERQVSAERPHFTSCRLEDENGRVVTEIRPDQPVRLVMSFARGRAQGGLHLGFYLDQCHEQTGQTLSVCGHTTLLDGLAPVTAAEGRAVVSIPALPYRPGTYKLAAGIGDDTACIVYDMMEIPFSIVSDREFLAISSVEHTWTFEA